MEVMPLDCYSSSREWAVLRRKRGLNSQETIFKKKVRSVFHKTAQSDIRSSPKRAAPDENVPIELDQLGVVIVEAGLQHCKLRKTRTFKPASVTPSPARSKRKAGTAELPERETLPDEEPSCILETPAVFWSHIYWKIPSCDVISENMMEL
eukprot:TRINITY_DN9643_c0_g1_i1.p1 TRINITY_DN9643_c0_g1~~TRINITY_DN9643_c0_g1_i1.p1  ORF type:complete len:151 (+),score=14.13 TRINITY_DN9643_c0_g1_i1:83-535(+)